MLELEDEIKNLTTEVRKKVRINQENVDKVFRENKIITGHLEQYVKDLDKINDDLNEITYNTDLLLEEYTKVIGETFKAIQINIDKKLDVMLADINNIKDEKIKEIDVAIDHKIQPFVDESLGKIFDVQIEFSKELDRIMKINDLMVESLNKLNNEVERRKTNEETLISYVLKLEEKIDNISKRLDIKDTDLDDFLTL